MKDRIEKILKLEQISSSKFADEIGVQRSSISHLFTGRNNPSLELVQKILQRFSNINSEWLLTGKGEMYKKLSQPSLFGNSVNTENINISGVLNDNRDKEIIHNKEKEIITNDIKENIQHEKPESKIIEKIIVFYSNNSFSEYIPAKK